MSVTIKSHPFFPTGILLHFSPLLLDNFFSPTFFSSYCKGRPSRATGYSGGAGCTTGDPLQLQC
jgi:hypothetical protein